MPNGVTVALQILVLSVWVRILVWQQNENLLLGGSYFVSKFMDENPFIGVPTKLSLEGESEGVRLPNAAKQQSLQQAQPERRILVWQQNK